MADGFTGAIGELRYRLTVTFHQFYHDVQRFYLRDVAGQTGTNPKAQVNSGGEMTIEIDRFCQIEVIRETSTLVIGSMPSFS